MKTVSLQLAQRLREAGYLQKEDQYFWWCNAGNKSEIIHPPDGMWEARINDHFNPEDVLKDKSKHFYVYYAAPTAEEIIDLLPDFVQFEKESLPFKLKIHKEQDEYQIVYTRDRRIITEQRDYQERGRHFDNSLADVAGKVWLYLKENNYV